MSQEANVVDGLGKPSQPAWDMSHGSLHDRNVSSRLRCLNATHLSRSPRSSFRSAHPFLDLRVPPVASTGPPVSQMMHTPQATNPDPACLRDPVFGRLDQPVSHLLFPYLRTTQRGESPSMSQDMQSPRPVFGADR